MENYGIYVKDWNTGDRGSSIDAAADFYVGNTDKKISFDQVKWIIKGEIDINSI